MKLVLVFLFCLISFSCRKRLDNFLFNPDNSITEYKLDDYQGEVSIAVGEEYYIGPEMINRFSVPLISGNDTLDIAMIYVGDISTINQDTVLLYCHGNKDHMDFYWPRQKLYANLGEKNRVGVLSLDYPGYGLSEGETTEENMYASVNLALEWLKEMGVTQERLVMFGFSLGSSPVCEIAGNEGFALRPNKIILEAPFASAEVMVQDASILNMPSSYFVNLKIDNAEEIKKCTMPLLWIHGRDDLFLSFETHGQVVYDNHLGVKMAVSVDGGGHENTPTIYGLSNYLKDIENFIFQ